ISSGLSLRQGQLPEPGKIWQRHEVSIDRFELVRSDQFRQCLGRERLEPSTADNREASKGYALGGLKIDLGLHRFEQVQLSQFSTKRLGALELGLVLLEEFEHIGDIGRGLGVVREQALPAPVSVEACKGLIDAKRKGSAITTARKDEGIATHECR